ncbi:hypothetical protein AGLY_002184 [Aphis glycines]|uniref:RING-type domain-containing protein n=1 Tax=Aphis glycines TaxID=307491 RepID=A0A6G0U2S9_APHGL|nr:hypothetical protein AGLY_002184 [Aphis glycines]
MACVSTIGRTKKCNIVPPNLVLFPVLKWYFVVIPRSSIHCPPVGGIHGRDNQSAFNEIDNGNEFIYTGSDGKDLSGNKRTALQSCDQELTCNNRALTLNCNTEINNKKEQQLWIGKKANHFDDLNKVTKTYSETEISGFVVWGFVLKKDDPAPALRTAFLDKDEETFMCICCQDIVFEPITLECSHNICKECLKTSFAFNVYQCPSRRTELGKTYLMNINTMLAILQLTRDQYRHAHAED